MKLILALSSSFALAAPLTPPIDIDPCQQIVNSCLTNKFVVKDILNEGTGLVVYCIRPIIQGVKQSFIPGLKPGMKLPNVSKEIISSCKASNPNFGLGTVGTPVVCPKILQTCENTPSFTCANGSFCQTVKATPLKCQHLTCKQCPKDHVRKNGKCVPKFHQLKVVIAADNLWRMNIAGKKFVGPIDGANGTQYAWSRVTTHKVKLRGDGPWVVGIEAKDYGTIAGLFSSIYLDGKPYTATGNNKTKFKASNTAHKNWLDVDFDDKSWATGAAISPSDCLVSENLWSSASGGKFFKDLKAQSPGLPIHASWFPSCKAVNKTLFFRVLITKPVKGGCNKNAK